MTKTFMTAAAIALLAAPTIAATPDQNSMMRVSLAQSLSSIGVDRDRVGDLSRVDLVTLKHIVEGGTSEGQKAFRARTFLDKVAN